MAGRRKRGLTKEDTDLWGRVAKTVAPLDPKTSPTKVDLMGSASPMAKPDRPQPEPSKLPVFRIGERSSFAGPAGKAKPSPGPMKPQAPKMDARMHGKMTRGKLKPEGRIDLHGMTLAQAQPVLTRFLHDAYAAKKRLVLVITGKGRDPDPETIIPVPKGILRSHVPNWLASGSLAGIVLQVTPAHIRHGGDGALYVYLRRPR